MKILWFSNKLLSEDTCGTGTWLDSMAQGLAQSGNVTLANISTGNVAGATRQDYGPVRQWIVPSAARLDGDGLPSRETVAAIVNAVEDYAPDLVHIWGTEGFWGLLTARGLVKRTALLEMQGAKHRIAPVFHGGLTAREQLACVGLKEILRSSTIWQERKRFIAWGELEKEIIAGHPYVGVQTKWVEAQVMALNGEAVTFHNDLILRKPFYAANPWAFSGKPEIFCLAAYAAPFKGLHVAIRALALVRKRFPDAVLNIGGDLRSTGLRRDGYIAWIARLAKRLGLRENVNWLGPLDASQIISRMQSASVMVIPSYIENCCTAMQEAMLIGVPLVASYAGGLPSLAKDETSALFFPLGDETACAYQMERLIAGREIAECISRNAREAALARNASDRIVSRQLDIYRQAVAGGKGRRP